MLKLLLSNFKTTNNCLIVIAPLVIYTMILFFYVNYILIPTDNIFQLTMSVFTFLVVMSGFAGMWLYFVQKTIVISNKIYIYDKDRLYEILGYLKSSYKGIGRFFVPLLGIEFSTFLFFLIISFSVSLFYPLSIEKVYSLPFFKNIIYVVLYFISYVYMFWIAEIVYFRKNAFISFKNAFIKLVSDIKKTILLMFIPSVIIIVLSYIAYKSYEFPILFLLSLLVFYYFFIYFIVLLFTYYEQNYIKNAQEA